MRLILLGPPGCGKGTQAKLLAERLNLQPIGTGDILREAIRLETPAGVKAEPFVKGGQLAPDSLVNDLVAELFYNGGRPERFVLDGYPRTLAQGASFDQVLRQVFLDISAVLHFVVLDEEIINRLSRRWICPNPTCKTVYNAAQFPAHMEKRCKRPDCNQLLVQRPDDREETVRERLRVYHRNTEELVEHYRRQGKLLDIQAQGEVEVVYARIMKALGLQG
jgi:adenylate kinase